MLIEKDQITNEQKESPQSNIQRQLPLTPWYKEPSNASSTYMVVVGRGINEDLPF